LNSTNQFLLSYNNIDSIRYIQEISGTRATILVIDKSTSLVTGLEDDTEQSFDAATSFSTYSTDPSRIFPYISIFENLWTQAGLYQQVWCVYVVLYLIIYT
jgi:hypothetical protein